MSSLSSRHFAPIFGLLYRRLCVGIELSTSDCGRISGVMSSSMSLGVDCVSMGGVGLYGLWLWFINLYSVCASALHVWSPGRVQLSLGTPMREVSC